MIARAKAAALAALLAAAGCERLENVGKTPAFTPPGEAADPAPPMAPQRVAVATPPPPPAEAPYSAASLWRSGPTSLFGDHRAQTVGDILTVVINIDDEAEIRNATERSRAGSEDLSASAFLGAPELLTNAFGITTEPAVGIASSSTSSGDGSVRRNEAITLRVAATVVNMLPNGHMVIAGSQEVRVNYELRDLQVAGIIRPEDISRRNEIPLDKIAEARVSYGGRGQISDVQQPRYGQQVVDILLPF